MAVSLSFLYNELARLHADCNCFALVPFIFSQLVTTANPTPANDLTSPKPNVPQAIRDPQEEALRLVLEATESQIDKHLRQAETNIFAASGNMQTLQKEIDEAGVISSLSGHTENLQREHKAEYQQLLSAKTQRDILQDVKDGDANRPNDVSLAQIRKLHAAGRIDEASIALEKLNEKLNSSSLKIDNQQYLAALKSAQEEYHKIDNRLENAENTARVARDGSVMLGAIVATGGGAGLAGLGVVGAGAVVSNATEQVGHVTLGNKTLDEATHDGLKQLGSDAITIGSTVAGIKGATAVATAGNGLAVTATGLAGVGAATSVAAEASQLGLQVAIGEKDTITTNDIKSLAVGAVGGAAGSLVGFGGGIGRGAASGLLQKSGIVGAETATDIAVTAAEEITRAKIEGREITAETLQQAGLNSLRSLVIGEAGAYARNHSTAPTPSRRSVDEIANDLTKVNRQQIGNVQEIIHNRDIIRDSEMDEIAPNQRNYAHGSAAVVRDILARSNTTEPTALVYYEGKELRAVNQLNHGAGDAYIRATNDAVRQVWNEINPQAQVLRGPNAAIIVAVPNMTAKDALAYHQQVQESVQQQLRQSPEMQDKLRSSGVQLSGEMRAGASEIQTAGVSSADTAKLSYYRALAEAGAAAEYEKQVSGSKPMAITEIAGISNTDVDTVVRNNFNFIPPEAQPGTFFKVHEQKQAMQQAWDALVGQRESFLDAELKQATSVDLQLAANKQRQAVAAALAAGPTSTTERQLHTAARVETVKYLAMTNRPGRFESNVQAVHEGTQVPIINTLAAERLQIDLLRNEIPIYRADGDADFLGPLFKNQQTELRNCTRDLNTEISNADLRYGELFNNSAAKLKVLENKINQASAKSSPILFTLAKQSNSDEFQLLVAGRDATAEHLRQGMDTVRQAFREVGMQEPFEKTHKITGATLGFGGTTASLGTDYRSLNQAVGAVDQLSDSAIVEQLKVVGKINDEITNLRKFTKLKDTSGSVTEITAEQFKEIQDTMRDFVGMYRDQVLVPVTARGENIATLKAALEQVTNLRLTEADFKEQFGISPDTARKGLNALNDVEVTISAFGTAHNPELNLQLGQRGPNGAFGDVLQKNGFDVDSFRREIDSLEPSLKNFQQLASRDGLFNPNSDLSLPAAEQLVGLGLENQLLRPTITAQLIEAREAQRLLGNVNEALYLDQQINLLEPQRFSQSEAIQRDKAIIQPLYDGKPDDIQNIPLTIKISVLGS